MNDNPHLMAIIENKISQARSCLHHGDAVKADDLLLQVGIYAASLDTHRARHRPDAGEASENRH